MFIFFVNFLNYKLRERINVRKDTFNKSKFILAFFFFLIVIFLLIFETSYFLKVNFMSLVCNNFKVFEDFIEIAFNSFSIQFVLPFFFSIIGNLLFEVIAIMDHSFFFFLVFIIFRFKSTHDQSWVHFAWRMALKILVVNIV